MQNADTAESETTQKAEERKLKGNTIKKTVLTILIALSYLCMGCYRTIPGPTLLYLKQLVDEKVSTMPVIFTSRSFGYVVGYIVGGISFDSMRSGYLRHLFIIVIKMIAAITAIGVPFCKHIIALSATFFAAGFCLSVLDVGFNTYLLFLWKGECHMYFQVLRFVYGAGSIIGPILARSFIDDIEAAKYSNSTETVDMILGMRNMPKLMYAYVFLACMIAAVTFLWIIMMIFPSACYKTSRRLGLSTRITTKPFFIFGVITTILLAFVVGSIDLGYQHMLATYAFTAYGLSTVQSADLTFTFWICYMFGALIAVFLSFRFHPFCMILCNLLTEVIAAVVLIMLAEVSHSYLFLGNALLGFGASSMLACTVLWFYSYIKITHKIMAVFLLAEAVAEMIIPEVLTAVLKYNFRGLFYFVLAVPVIYSAIFMIQCVVFFPYGEKYMSDYGKKQKKHSRFRICPVFLYPPLKISSMDSQTDFEEEELGEIFEPRNKESMTQTDEDQKRKSTAATHADIAKPKGKESDTQTKPNGEDQDVDAEDNSEAPPDSSAIIIVDSGEEEEKKDSQKYEEQEQPKEKKKSVFGSLFQKKEKEDEK
ncbi:Sodium-dependent glucose transporter 1 [Araneus ventricosus]|uniref:Sodium-dependent glucose transporter 1 n=1 Tax=Araneus ventricosus TaxID=182803 RepID=A0A4Y2CDI2_ARAVE|nr:Sodium-dependent glucose transporter 1 [Araneus ventricosus]